MYEFPESRSCDHGLDFSAMSSCENHNNNTAIANL